MGISELCILAVGAKAVGILMRFHNKRRQAKMQNERHKLYESSNKFVQKLGMRNQVPRVAFAGADVCSKCHTVWPERCSCGKCLEDLCGKSCKC